MTVGHYGEVGGAAMCYEQFKKKRSQNWEHRERYRIAEKMRGPVWPPNPLFRRPFYLAATMRAPQAVGIIEWDAYDWMLVAVPDDMAAITVVSNHLMLLRSKAFGDAIYQAYAAS